MESDIQKLFRVGNYKEIKALINDDPTIINKIDNKFNWTPLYRSVLCEHEDVINLLLVAGADPNIQNRLGEAPLHQAVDIRNEVICRMLVEHAADVNL